jgi:hypothetical protein
MPQTRLEDLPNKLLLEIGQHVSDSPPSLLALCRTSQKFYELLLALLYKQISLVDEQAWASSTALLGTLLKKPEYANFVRTVTVPLHYRLTRDSDIPLGSSTVGLWEHFSTILDIVNRANPQTPPEIRHDWFTKLGNLDANLALILTICPKIRRLDIGGVGAHNIPFVHTKRVLQSQHSPDSAKTFRTLQHLHTLELECLYHWSENHMPLHIQLQRYPSLRVIKLSGYQYVTLSVANSLSVDDTPKLEHLCLAPEVILDPGALNDFLQRPSVSSLRVLEPRLRLFPNHFPVQVFPTIQRLPLLEEVTLHIRGYHTGPPLPYCALLRAGVASMNQLKRLTATTGALTGAGPVSLLFSSLPRSIQSIELYGFPFTELDYFSTQAFITDEGLPNSALRELRLNGVEYGKPDPSVFTALRPTFDRLQNDFGLVLTVSRHL